MVAADDRAAVEVYRFCSQNRISIPGDLSVVGCGNDPSVSSLLTPGLTTYNLPYEELGQSAVLHLLAEISKPPAFRPFRHLLRGQLVERASCCGIN